MAEIKLLELSSFSPIMDKELAIEVISFMFNLKNKKMLKFSPKIE